MSEMSKTPVDHVATFVAGAGFVVDKPLVAKAFAVADLLHSRFDFEWLDEGVAADVWFLLDPEALDNARARLHEALEGLRVDVILQQAAMRRKALLVADMDSTMIAQECIDELADLVGLRAHISAITERAMRGEVEFESALRERVALLAGLPAEAIDRLVEQRITPTAGARALVATMRAHGAYTALVSGGFTLFTDRIAARLGFDEARANRLEIRAGALSGVILPPVIGREGKRAVLENLRVERKLERAATLAVGDGANDLDMLQQAGLGVAFHAKPNVANAAHVRIDHADLTALLYAQGYRRADFIE
jgi:phosphoserine phosphatase